MNGTPLRLVLDPVGDELDAALECEADVFLATYGNTPKDFEREYGPYADSTGFITILEESGRALATTRFIAHGPAGLKTLNDVGRVPWKIDGLRSARAAGVDPTKSWDLATIAVRRVPGRSPLCSAALYHGLLKAARANSIESVVMIMDVHARLLLSASGIHPAALPGCSEGEYLGSERSMPLWANVDRLFDHQRRTEPDAYRLIYRGVGLDGITLPSEWTWQPPSARSSTQA